MYGADFLAKRVSRKRNSDASDAGLPQPTVSAALSTRPATQAAHLMNRLEAFHGADQVRAEGTLGEPVDKQNGVTPTRLHLH